MITDAAPRRAAQPTEQRAAQAGVQTDGQVEVPRLQTLRMNRVVAQALEPSLVIGDDFGHTHILAVDLTRQGRAEHADLGVRKAAMQGFQRRQRQHRVADGAQLDQEDAMDTGALESHRNIPS
jgi:hypothetical protein